MDLDHLIVGTGLTGAVIARVLSEHGRRVLVVDRRPHLGGNVHDHHHPSGIRVHTYGPHYFRTNDDDLWAFVQRFARFAPYEARVQTLVDGMAENWPPTESTLRRLAGPDWRPGFTGAAGNFEQAALSVMPRLIYEKFVKGYTEKQWGVPAHSLSPSLARRFSLRPGEDTRLVRHRYQGIPEEGYAKFMERLLEGLPVLLNFDYLAQREVFRPRLGTIFTGCVDEFFGFDLGRLSYRGQRRVHEYRPDIGFLLPAAQVNNPSPLAGQHIRTLEWKQMMPAGYRERILGTVLTREYPFTPTDPDAFEYPFPNSTNARLYESYRARAAQIPGLLVCGRLGEYRYFDMDQAIGRARQLAERLLQTPATSAGEASTPGAPVEAAN